MDGHQPPGEYTLKQIIALRNQALEDFGQAARREREALEQMGARASQEHENWVNRLKAVESVIESMKVLEEEIRHREKSLKEHHEKLERGWNQVAAAYQDILDLALMSVKLAWLNLQARDETNAARSKAASQQMLDLMDQIVVLVLPDPSREPSSTTKSSTPYPVKNRPHETGRGSMDETGECFHSTLHVVRHHSRREYILKSFDLPGSPVLGQQLFDPNGTAAGGAFLQHSRLLVPIAIVRERIFTVDEKGLRCRKDGFFGIDDGMSAFVVEFLNFHAVILFCLGGRQESRFHPSCS